MAKTTEKTEAYVGIERLKRAHVKMYLLGTSPLVMNRMPAKARQQLLWPMRKLNKAAREQTQKHNPYAEYRDAIYRCRDDKAPTYVHMPDGAIKKALAQAAVDIPGATKAQIGRLVQVTDPTLHIYGTPFLYMDIVRQAGISKTPDIRTRAMFPDWCCVVNIQYIQNLVRHQDVINLMDAAGLIVGIGDGRTEKGTFNNGSWEIVDENDERWQEIAKSDRAVQEAAMAKPVCVDTDTEELLSWFDAEVIKREHDKMDGAPQDRVTERGVTTRKKKRNGDDDAITTAA